MTFVKFKKNRSNYRDHIKSDQKCPHLLSEMTVGENDQPRVTTKTEMFD